MMRQITESAPFHKMTRESWDRIVSSNLTAAHYAASKHGLLGLMGSLAAEYAKTNLTVNAICPGFVDTPMTDISVSRVSKITGRSEQDSRSAITNMNASGRLVDPVALGNIIALLCLPLSRDINGAVLTIDGGPSA